MHGSYEAEGAPIGGEREIVVLSGMMGVGKSRVAQALARRLGWRALDLDAEIERIAGRRIPEIIAREGEAAFREREREAARALSSRDDLRRTVLASGGWTVGDPGSLAVLESLGPRVCLTASPATIVARLGPEAERSRPVLAGPGPLRARVASLLTERWPVYGSAPHQVATDGRAPASIARHVERVLAATAGSSAQAVPIAASERLYSVVVGDGLLDHLGSLLSAAGLDTAVALLSDERVAALYGDRAAEAFARAGLEVEGGGARTMPVGETAKSPATVVALWEALAEAGLDRRAAVVGLGGGVVTDTAGFVAAGLLRGIRWAAAPTTLLGMVDASLGGKTGVNLAAGKNLAGAFWHPTIVVADPTTLRTLDPTMLREGLAEAVKAAVIGDVDLLEDLEARGAPPLGHWLGEEGWSGLVARAAAVKAGIVSQDAREAEGGRRVLLNLGHTFAHAIERESDYRVRHGAAVAVGLVAAARLAEAVGVAEEPLAERLTALLRRLGLPTDLGEARAQAASESDGGAPLPPLTPSALLASMAHDKKRDGSRLRFVLPVAPGDVRLFADVPTPTVRSVLETMRGGG